MAGGRGVIEVHLGKGHDVDDLCRIVAAACRIGNREGYRVTACIGIAVCRVGARGGAAIAKIPVPLGYRAGIHQRGIGREGHRALHAAVHARKGHCRPCAEDHLL